MVMYRLRQIATQLTGSPCMGLSVPNHISCFFENTFFKIQRSGTSIVFTSGAKHILTNKEIEDYNFNEVRV